MANLRVDQYSQAIYYITIYICILRMVRGIEEILSTRPRTCLKPYSIWKLLWVGGSWQDVMSLKLSILPMSMRVFLWCIPSTTLVTFHDGVGNLPRISIQDHPSAYRQLLDPFSFVGQV